MRLAAVMLSLLPLVLAEFTLRCLPVASSEAVDEDPLVDLHQIDPLFQRNEVTGRWEIPPERFNFFRPDAFLIEKPAGWKRIFVLGGSTVQGRPYATETAFSTWLKLQLQAASPETSFEVVNCGGVSYASYRVARILDEVLQHQPDAIILYGGHNEFLEDREYAAVRTLSPLHRYVATAATRIRLVAWIHDHFPRAAIPKTVMSSEVQTRLDQVGGLNRYVRDPAWRTGVELHFAQTLHDMIRKSSSAGVPLILCVPASDLVRTPPFKVVDLLDPESEEGRKFQASWQKALDASRTVDERLEACEECLRLDPEHAGVSFVAGRLHYDRGDPPAQARLTAARDFDVCPLRATSPILTAVRSIAALHEIPIIDTERLLDQRNHAGLPLPDGIPDPECFVDHVHPTIAGHQLIATALFEQIQQWGWFSVSEGMKPRYETLVKQHLETLGEDYYARGRQRLRGLRRWAAGRARESFSDQELEGEVD